MKHLAGIVGILLAGYLVVHFSGEPDQDQVQFRRYDPVAVAEAKKAHKPVLIYVTAPWMPDGREQNRVVFGDEKVKAALEPFTRFKLDLGPGPDTEQAVALLNVTAIPLFTFTNAQGKQVVELAGLQSAEALIAAAARATAP